MDLDIVRVIKSIPREHEPEDLAALMTPWGEALAADEEAMPLSKHPRPQFARRTVRMLNGWWEYAFVRAADAREQWGSAPAPEVWDGRIRVPFSPEAALSGVGRTLGPDELLWYRREVIPPHAVQGHRCLLHFDGVDHACAIYLGGSLVGTHEGAYQPFECDVTQELLVEGKTVLEVCVFDPSDAGTQLRGKQRLKRGSMWYTAQSGIWQSVWLEVVPEVHLEGMSLRPDPDRQALLVTAWLSGQADLEVELVDEAGTPVARGGAHPAQGIGIVSFEMDVASPHLWHPTDPYLYRLNVSYGDDRVRSYCAFRTVGIEVDDRGHRRLCLNHEPLFLRALLDQGYWPDGLMTPPSDEAMVYDLRFVHDSGFNAVRKHVKVEPERWYWHADRLGVLVLQDMPSGGENPNRRYALDEPTLFRGAWHARRDDDAASRRRLGAGDEHYRAAWTENMSRTVARLSEHPCIVAWVLFNESWGQFDASRATQLARTLDPLRPIISVSGWYDQGCGDFHAVHNYFRKVHPFPDPYAGRSRAPRAEIVSEFGGLAWCVDGHSSLKRSYGYAEFETYAAWRQGLEELLARADALEEQGVSGFVYTQLSDVEEEVNGLLTYDRRLSKLALPPEEGLEGSPDTS